MQQFGGIDSKRHFTVVMGDKEHGLYVSSSPSSAAKKAVTKLCAKNKSKKVNFHIREITQGSKKKTYGPYLGYIEKLKDPIELKGRVIKYKPFAKLQKKEGGGFFSVSEFNTNETGQLTSNAKNKMLENFKQEFSSQTNHLKERRFGTDTFYFGANNLIHSNRKQYFPFSICNIVHNEEDLVSIYFNQQTQTNEKRVNNTVLKLRILIFDPQNNKKLSKELDKITEYSQEYTELGQIITEKYSVIYEQDGLFIFEFNLLYYYQIIEWIISFGKKLLQDPNNYFSESKKLIIYIFNNLKRLEEPHKLGPFHKLFWNYKYARAMELCLTQIYTESFNFQQKMSELPGQIEYIIKKKQEQQEQEQLEQRQQQLYQQQQEKKEFNRKLKELCGEGYKPVEYPQNSNNCRLQLQDRCIGCQEKTWKDKFENLKRGYNKKVENLSHEFQALTPRLLTSNQLTSNVNDFFYKAKIMGQRAAAPISNLTGALGSVGNFISSKMPQYKGQYPDTYNPSSYSWSNKYWLEKSPRGQKR